MNYFIESVKDPESYEQEANPIFQESVKESRQPVIPPVGIAQPELVEEFQKSLETGDDEQLANRIKEAEEYYNLSEAEKSDRQLASLGIRAGEGLLGSWGSFANMLMSINPGLELPGMEMENEQGITEKYPLQKLPGPHELREKTKQLTGTKYEPKSKGQEIAQETAGDLGSLLSTGLGGFFQKVGAAVIGQGSKQIIKGSGGGEKAQEYGKLGAMMLFDISRLGNAPRVAGRAMHDVINEIPQGMMISARPTERALTQLRNRDWFRTGRSPSKGPAMDEIGRIERQINYGQMSMRDAIQIRKDINEARKQLGGFSLDANRIRDTRAARRYLDEVDNAISSSIENYGSHVDPAWLNRYRAANEAFRVTQRSQVLSEFIEKRAKPLKSDASKLLFHAGIAASPSVATLGGIATLGLGVAGATAKTIQIVNRLANSSILRRHYLDVMRAATTNNAALINQAIDKFDKEAMKLEKTNNNRNSPHPQADQ